MRRILLRLLPLAVLLATGSATAPAPLEHSLPVRGWLVHWPDRAYLDRVLEAAPRYRINHLELSHDIVMEADEVADEPERARLVEEVAARAKRLGIKSYIWAHELNTRTRELDLDPQSEEGRRFWEGRQTAYRKALERCPSVAGVILMFGSSPTSVWDVRGKDAFWQHLTVPERIRFVADRVRQVVVREKGRELMIRDFNHGPGELRWLVDAFRDYADTTLVSKPEPQDFQFFYPHSPSIGAFGKAPQILEIDLNGEYWGQSLIPVSQVDYLRYRLRNPAAGGISGAVGRIDTYQNSALGTPNEVNLYAYSRLLEDRDLSTHQIYSEWLERRYRLKPDSDPARSMEALLERTYRMAGKLFYTRGFWTWKNQSQFPDSAGGIDRGIQGKSTAQWDPARKEEETKLIHPDRETVAAILREKAEAVALADTNAREVEALREQLPAAEYDDFHTRLRRAAELARAYQAIAGAYWRVKLAKTEPDAPDAAPKACTEALDQLDRWGDEAAERFRGTPFFAKEGPRLKSLARELRAQRAASGR